MTDIGRELHEIKARLTRVERSSRLSHAALDDTAIVVKDSIGTVRGHIGMQPDGTIGLIAVDGPAPGAPSAPIVTPSLGGLRIVWDGTLADGSDLPADFDHVAVHVSTSSGFTPSAATFVGTITRSGDGGMLPVTPLPYTPHYVVLTAVNTSAAASDPSAEVTATPTQVDGPDLAAGSVTAASIEAGAVTADKLEAILQLVTRLVAGDPAGARVELNEDGLRVYDGSGTLVIRFDSADGSAVFTGAITGSTITGSTVTGGTFQTATSGQRIRIGISSGHATVSIYDASNNLVGSLSDLGVGLRGTSGALLNLNPDSAYPSLSLSNAAATNFAYVQAVESVTGDANLETLSGTFTGSGFTDMNWHTFMGHDYYVVERLRRSNLATVIGGRLYLSPTVANLTFKNASDTTQDTVVIVQANLIQASNGRFQILPPASSNSGLYVQLDPAHTGLFARFSRNGVDYFTVDKDGNLAVPGTITATGNITTGGTVLREASWSNLSFGSGWTGYGSPFGNGRYRLNTRGGVDLRDMVKRTATTTPTNGETIATLPVGYRPANSIQWQQIVGGSGGVLSMNVSTAGAITITSLNAAASTYLATGTGYISLNNCSFPLDA